MVPITSPTPTSERAFGRDERAQVARGESDGPEQAELASPLEHVARQDRGQPERPQQQPQRAERLERREIGVLDLVIRGEPRPRVGDVHAEVRQSIFEQRRDRGRLSASGASIIQTR